MSSINNAQTALLIVHSMNPFGTKNGRRFNFNNVDLNRNCFDYRRRPFPGAQIHNQNYANFRSRLENKISLVGLAWRGLMHRSELTRALGGQYEYPQGIYYGGAEIQPECQAVQQLIDSHLAGAVNIAHFDFHTGLGKSGISQIMLNPPPQDEAAKTAYGREVQFLKTLFPAKECAGVCEILDAKEHDFLTSGDLTQWLNDTYPEKRLHGMVFSVTSEIGTDGPLYVLPAIINENVCTEHPESCDAAEKVARAQTLLHEFIPLDVKWSEQVARGGAQVCKALQRFSNL